jgi:hypothetical protein
MHGQSWEDAACYLLRGMARVPANGAHTDLLSGRIVSRLAALASFASRSLPISLVSCQVSPAIRIRPGRSTTSLATIAGAR